MNTKHQEISAKILDLLDRGLILRRKWSEGEAMCLLAAADPEVAKYESSDYCPLDLMPQWLAYLTPSMDDEGSAAAWEPMVRRYADLFSRWHVLTPEAWERARIQALLSILDLYPENDLSVPLVRTWVSRGCDLHERGDLMSRFFDLDANDRGAYNIPFFEASLTVFIAFDSFPRSKEQADVATTRILDAIENEIVLAEQNT